MDDTLELYDRAGRPAAKEVRYVSAQRALNVSYADGADYVLSAELLRVESPSAEVKGHAPHQRKTVTGCRGVGIAKIEPVGRYAIRITFDDGHDTGLYSWAYLYQLGATRDEVWQDYLNAIERMGLSRDPLPGPGAAR